MGKGKVSEEKREGFNYRKTTLYQKYSKHSNPWVYGSRAYPWDRDAQSDRNKRARHLASKSLRRGLEREANRIISESFIELDYETLDSKK